MTTRHPATIHAVPWFASGDHRPSESCPCGPVQATDLCEPGRLVVVHRRMDQRDHDGPALVGDPRRVPEPAS